MNRCWTAPGLALAIVLLACATAFAQAAPAAKPGNDQGRVAIQGQKVEAPAPAPAAPSKGGILDYREEMRSFVQKVAAYARSQRPDFSVIAGNGLELLRKRDDMDVEKTHPAVAYLRAIDGILQAPLFYGIKDVDLPRKPELLDKLLGLAGRAVAERLPVLVMDFARTPAFIDEILARSETGKFIPFVADAMGMAINHIPRLPARPIHENSRNVLSVRDVRNFLYLADITAFGREDEFAMALHDTNFDLLVVDIFIHRKPLSRRAVETLKYKKLGARRLVFAHLDITSAETYRYYWKPDWREGSPSWIQAPHPDNPDKYFVQYWNPEWQNTVSGNPNSFIYGLVAQGFDGVVVEGLDNYLFFEGGVEAILKLQSGEEFTQ